MIFENKCPEDKEWSAHIRLLNNSTPPEFVLRHIIIYINAGPHYPKHMHQDLIEQYFNNRLSEIQVVVQEQKTHYEPNDDMFNPILEAIKKQRFMEAQG